MEEPVTDRSKITWGRFRIHAVAGSSGTCLNSGSGPMTAPPRTNEAATIAALPRADCVGKRKTGWPSIRGNPESRCLQTARLLELTETLIRDPALPKQHLSEHFYISRAPDAPCRPIPYTRSDTALYLLSRANRRPEQPPPVTNRYDARNPLDITFHPRDCGANLSRPYARDGGRGHRYTCSCMYSHIIYW